MKLYNYIILGSLLTLEISTSCRAQSVPDRLPKYEAPDFSTLPRPVPKAHLLTTITGIVTDADGKPLPAATLLFRGTLLGVVADSLGCFRLPVPQRLASGRRWVRVRAMYIGYGFTQVRLDAQQPGPVTIVIPPDTRPIIH